MAYKEAETAALEMLDPATRATDEQRKVSERAVAGKLVKEDTVGIYTSEDLEKPILMQKDVARFSGSSKSFSSLWKLPWMRL